MSNSYIFEICKEIKDSQKNLAEFDVWYTELQKTICSVGENNLTNSDNFEISNVSNIIRLNLKKICRGY